jgi:uncharacterized damage-inducible protein DinB
MSLARLATHLATLPDWTSTILCALSFDLAAPKPPAVDLASCAELLRTFDASAQRARVTLDRSDAEYMALWTLRRGNQDVFSVPRVTAFRTWVMNHLIHHRGQLTVYLRLLDVSLPATYGPSADEQPERDPAG